MKRSRDSDMAGQEPPHQPVQKRTTFRAVATQETAPYRQLKVEDALAYLDRVKRQFGEQPYIYNQFLEIMKNFKAQTIDTPGVIKRVSELFKGHNSLILGFNTFLPPGYKIEVVTETVPMPPPQTVHAPVRAAVRQPQPQRRGEHGQPLEFDHAISYVTKIKRRFVNDPNTYKAFLDILHTYQKQQRSIKDVLERVSTLFRDHPDLLQDFTYFLPDAVQPQVEQILRQNKVKGMVPRSRRGRRKTVERDMDLDGGTSMRVERDRPHRRSRRERSTLRDEPLRGSLPPSERQFFQKIKSSLGSRERWQEFLKCLDLYAREVVSKAEVLTLLADVFGVKHVGLFEDFKMMLNMRGTIESPNDVWYSLPVAEINFSQCRQCTPSYRALPESYPMFKCSERTRDDAAVLNDRWVSVPTGSEDFSFKSMRKNQYEEALFKCEDERYEVDMIIENNAAAIRVLEPLAEEIATLQAANPAAWQFRLDSKSLGVLHIKAIVRLYGDHGAEMMDLLRRNPAGAIPVILKRLKEKDAEWKKVKAELNKTWKEVLEKNYHKSLDHRSFYFKQADKRAVMPKNMLVEIKGKAEAARDGKAEEGEGHVVMHHPDTRVHVDAANAIAYAIEKSSSADKEALARVWSSFVERVLRFPSAWSLKRPSGSGATTFRVRQAVNTPYGLGQVTSVRRPDPYSGGITYEVSLVWGRVYMRPDTISAVPDEDDGSSDPDTATCREGTTVCYGSAQAYYFFRLYSMVVDRLHQAKQLCMGAHDRRLISHPADKVAAAARAKAASSTGAGAGAGSGAGSGSGDDDDVEMSADDEVPADTSSENLYKYFLTALYSVLDGSRDASKFEDECRTLMGTLSYPLFTLDKVVTGAVKQLAHLASDDGSRELTDRFVQQQIMLRRQGVDDIVAAALALDYARNAAEICEENETDGFCLRYTVGPTVEGKQEAALAMSFLGGAEDRRFAFGTGLPAAPAGAGAGAGAGSGAPTMNGGGSGATA